MTLPFSKLGPYYLIRRIGGGGMAEVYLACEEQIDGTLHSVALKLVHHRLVKDETIQKLFLAEADHMRRLRHPNICRLLDLQQFEDCHYMVMELVVGESLKRIMEYYRLRAKPCPLPIASKVVIEVCKALAYLHSFKDSEDQPLGLVHRDVNPHNILLTYEGEVKLIDLGIARPSVYSLDTPDPIQGKIGYMSPEQIRGELLDGRSDIFACGVVLFELVGGTRLFKAASEASTRHKILTEPPPPLPLISKMENEALQPILSKALAKQPNDRYLSADDFAKDLLDQCAPVSDLKTWITSLFGSPPPKYKIPPAMLRKAKTDL